MLLARIRVDTAVRVTLRPRAARLRPAVGRAGLLLRLPVVTDLLVRVLQRAVRDPVRVGLVALMAAYAEGAVVCLRERGLGVLLGTRNRPGQLALDRTALLRLRHGTG